MFIGLVAGVKVRVSSGGQGFLIVSIKIVGSSLAQLSSALPVSRAIRIPSALMLTVTGRGLTFLLHIHGGGLVRHWEERWLHVMRFHPTDSDAPSGKHACSSDDLTGPKLGST